MSQTQTDELMGLLKGRDLIVITSALIAVVVGLRYVYTRTFPAVFTPVIEITDAPIRQGEPVIVPDFLVVQDDPIGVFQVPELLEF